jgi:LPS sulfotransferase NodH
VPITQAVTHTLFTVVTHPRTGSTWLCDVLDTHPAIRCHSEVFHPHAVYYSKRSTAAGTLGTDLAERDADPHGFASRLFAHHEGRAAVGFKVMAGHAPQLVADLLRESRIRKLVLRRENRIRVYVSEQRAATVNAWRGVNYDGLKIHVDPGTLVAYADHYDVYFDWVERSVADQPALHLTYESLFRPETVAAALEFLGVEPDLSQLRTNVEAQSSDSLRDAIANYDELLSELAGTPLEAELLELV